MNSAILCGIIIRKVRHRGVAQLVARDVWDVDAAGSNPVTPTNTGIHKAFEYQKSRIRPHESRKVGLLCGFLTSIGGTIWELGV